MPKVSTVGVVGGPYASTVLLPLQQYQQLRVIHVHRGVRVSHPLCDDLPGRP